MKTALLKHNEVTDFGLAHPYNGDIWNVREWDIYKDAIKDYKKARNACSKAMGKNMDFSICENRVIREEAKYFASCLLTAKKISLLTFAEYADRFKLLFAFVNNRQYRSVLEIDTADYERHIAKGHSASADDGGGLARQEFVPLKKRSRLLSFLDSFKETIQCYMEASKPIYERDLWSWRELAPDEIGASNLKFDGIAQRVMKQSAKNFLKFKLASCTVQNAYKHLSDIKIFCGWLYEYDDGIVSFRDVTRDTLEDYFAYLRTESGFSQNMINRNILNLSILFEYGIMNCDSNFPGGVLF